VEPVSEEAGIGASIRARLGVVPAGAYVCALIALLNALTWSLIVPLFQVPDEQAHVAYGQYVAETGKPPSRGAPGQGVSEQERNLLTGLAWKQTVHRPWNRPLASPSAHRRLERAVDEPAETVRRGPGGGTVINYSPLYYAGTAAAYRLSPATDLFDRVHAMRLVSVLLAAATVLLSYLFLRELLPGTPWAWPVGALAVAFQPLFGFIGGGVNNDNLIVFAATATLLMLAIGFRRGLTPARGAALGAAVAVGLLAKPSMVGLLPGVALGVLVMILRASPQARRRTLLAAGAAAATAVIPVLIYVALNSAVWDRGLFFAGPGVESSDHAVQAEPGSLAGRLGYIWQFYLPRLPSMTPEFQGYPLREIWFEGFIGRFGWVDYGFADWAYDLALGAIATVLFLAARELVVCRRAIRNRLGELVTYLAIAAGLVLLLNWIGYDVQLGEAEGFEQARYLLPLVGLYAAIISLAARGAGRRYGPAVGVVIVSVAIAHSLVAMLLTLTRYYG
jgi:4-amino-4-deoxy-L-arabinose transferase-like glycosyltransferase